KRPRSEPLLRLRQQPGRRVGRRRQRPLLPAVLTQQLLEPPAILLALQLLLPPRLLLAPPRFLGRATLRLTGALLPLRPEAPIMESALACIRLHRLDALQLAHNADGGETVGETARVEAARRRVERT